MKVNHIKKLVIIDQLLKIQISWIECWKYSIKAKYNVFIFIPYAFDILTLYFFGFFVFSITLKFLLFGFFSPDFALYTRLFNRKKRYLNLF